MRLDAAVGVISAAPPMAPMYRNPSGTGDISRPELFDRRISTHRHGHRHRHRHTKIKEQSRQKCSEKHTHIIQSSNETPCEALALSTGALTPTQAHRYKQKHAHRT